MRFAKSGREYPPDPGKPGMVRTIHPLVSAEQEYRRRGIAAAVRSISENPAGRRVVSVLHGYGDSERKDLKHHGYTQFEDSRLGRTRL